MRFLHDSGIVMNVKKIRRLMRKYGLFCPIRRVNPYRRMAKALATHSVAANVVNREFKRGPRKVLLMDIIYLFFGIADLITTCASFDEVVARVDDWMDYYNNDRGQWDQLKLTPREYYEYLQTGIYPLPVYKRDTSRGSVPGPEV